jgi:uncharacterized protein RhaS with RHS repeats
VTDYTYRWYDPVTGRWPSRDPIAERGGVNLYAIAKNNLQHSIDVLGLIEAPPDPNGDSDPTPGPASDPIDPLQFLAVQADCTCTKTVKCVCCDKKRDCGTTRVSGTGLGSSAEGNYGVARDSGTKKAQDNWVEQAKSKCKEMSCPGKGECSPDELTPPPADGCSCIEKRII